MRIKITELRKILEQKLRLVNLTASEARIIADEYLIGELKGKKSHGIYGFIHSYKKRKTKKRGHFKVFKNKPAFAYIKGNKDYGQLVADYAIKLAIKKAKKSGVFTVGGGDVYAFLRPATWAEMAAKQGMIALCFNYGGGPLIAPTGAREPILSTNPIGIGIPYKPFPFVIDMATSNRAFWNVRMARAFKKKISKDWGIDAQGKPTTDPNKLIAVLPFGGYKGYILATAIEILTGPLVRTKVGKSTRKLRGFLFMVIDPTAFTSRKEFNKDVKKLIRDIKTAKKVKGVKEILIPGERAYKIEQKNLKRGWLEIEDSIIKDIRNL
ncbi:Ldh family oxidoreductase [Patescibacteria group bacterium]|nr:Ldh family oxidoreductase [Patescibacteria group bacterium]MBU0964598.1 Ldh family oxidoreductase [Patescibacteria group bacterium]